MSHYLGVAGSVLLFRRLHTLQGARRRATGTTPADAAGRVWPVARRAPLQLFERWLGLERALEHGLLQELGIVEVDAAAADSARACELPEEAGGDFEPQCRVHQLVQRSIFEQLGRLCLRRKTCPTSSTWSATACATSSAALEKWMASGQSERAACTGCTLRWMRTWGAHGNSFARRAAREQLCNAAVRYFAAGGQRKLAVASEADMWREGLRAEPRTCSVLLKHCRRGGMVDAAAMSRWEARIAELSREQISGDTRGATVQIVALVEGGRLGDALRVFADMERAGVERNGDVPLRSSRRCRAHAGPTRRSRCLQTWGAQEWAAAVTFSTVIKALSDARRTDEALRVFADMEPREWSARWRSARSSRRCRTHAGPTRRSGCLRHGARRSGAQHGDVQHGHQGVVGHAGPTALQVFADMERAGRRDGGVHTVIKALSGAQDRRGARVFADMERAGVERDTVTFSTVIKALSDAQDRRGIPGVCRHEARPSGRNIWTFNTVIKALSDARRTDSAPGVCRHGARR